MPTFPQIKRAATVPVEHVDSPPIVVAARTPAVEAFPAPYGPNDVVELQPSPATRGSIWKRLGLNFNVVAMMMGWFVFIATVIAFLAGTFNIRVPGGEVGFRPRKDTIVATDTVKPAPVSKNAIVPTSAENLLELIGDYRAVSKKEALSKGKDTDAKAAKDALLARIRTITDGLPVDKLPPEALRFKVVR